ncbi:cytochrome P450 [Amylostereum chailletii]|nr:cytochrome P450 [Amylostereum chailletii]
MSAFTWVDAVAGTLFIFFLWKWIRRGQRLPFPPGPPGLPLVGSLFEFPAHHPWYTFADWGEKWGGILSVNLFGQKFVIINDPDIASDLLDKRGSIYADRPSMPMAALCGWTRSIALSRSSPKLREQRRLIGRVIGTRGTMVKFYPAADYQATMCLKRILDDPKRLDEVYARRFFLMALVLHITYGYKIKEDGRDELIDLADNAIAEFSSIVTPGAYLVDTFPWLMYVPSWMPGGGFKQAAVQYKKNSDALADVPFTWLQEQMAKEEGNTSYTHDLLLDQNASEERMYDIKWSAASFYGGKTVSIIYAYFLAMCLYPEVQQKAHDEIDMVVGKARFPSFGDRPRLLYVEAICKELLRWHAVVPLAVPHRALKSDIYRGYLIPEGTLVLVSIGSIHGCCSRSVLRKFLHDPEVYKDPYIFNPDRFLGPNPERDPTQFCFGYGRRVCPGAHLADISIWITVAKACAAFDITKDVDPEGKTVEPINELEGSTIV